MGSRHPCDRMQDGINPEVLGRKLSPWNVTGGYTCRCDDLFHNLSLYFRPESSVMESVVALRQAIPVNLVCVPGSGSPNLASVRVLARIGQLAFPLARIKRFRARWQTEMK